MAYRYDAEGNRIAAGGDVFTFDHRNRLDTATVDDVLVDYVYDESNHLIARRSGGTRERYVRDRSQTVLSDRVGSGSEAHLWGGAIDQLLAETDLRANRTYWTLGDHLGSVRDRVDAASGVVVHHVDYDPFGRTETASGSDPIGGGLSYGYTARPTDTQTGLQNNRNRWYDADEGRWISQDPIGFQAGDANLYRYVGNSPLISIDPIGLETVAPLPDGVGKPKSPSTSGITIDGLIQGHLIGRIIQIGKLGSAGPHLYCKDYSSEFRSQFLSSWRNVLRREVRERIETGQTSGRIHLELNNVRNPDGDGSWRWVSERPCDTGWWLHGAHSVSVEAYFNIEEVDGIPHATDLQWSWKWHDEIDGRGIGQWYSAKKTWAQFWKGIPNCLVESILWDKGVDGLLDADFTITVGTGLLNEPDLPVYP